MITFLIGCMGAGKTTLGKGLAVETEQAFFDLDWVIESKTGRKVSTIFAEQGESVFREIERQTLVELTKLETQNGIIACGGGTPCFGNNMEWMKKMGTSIYLQVSAEELARRLQPQKSFRPIIQDISDTDLPQFIRNLLDQRENWYLQADYVLQGDQLNVQHLLNLLT